MGRISYEQAFADHAYLWKTYGPAHDMTGGYVDQDDLDRLLADPTKKTARDCLISQIEYWFSVGPEDTPYGCLPEGDDPHLQEIAERYGREIVP